MKLWKYLKNKMQLNLHQTICEGNFEITYGEAIMISEDFAKKLKGIKCCAILCQFEMAAGIALLSCFAAGVTAVPLSQRYGEYHSNKILDEISPDAIITDIGGELQIVYISDSRYVQPKIHPALIMCTSGTTGKPKGAMLTELNIITNVSDIAFYFGIDNSDSLLILRPLYHCAVLTGEFLVGLIKGSKIRFYSGDFNPAKALELLKKYRITAFCGTPTLLNMISYFKKAGDEYRVKHICISGECMGKEVAGTIYKAFSGARIYHVYGLTEASPRVTYLPPELFEEFGDCVGLPLMSVSLKIVSEEGSEVNKEQVGMLWIKGDNVMAGYYNNAKKTSEILKDGWLCTGDMAMFNRVGLLKIMGRSDDMIIRAGMNIYPQEIECALRGDPRVIDVLVSGKPDEYSGSSIVLDIVGEFSDLNEVRRLCRDCLPTYQMPSKINLLKEIPKTGSGKIIRRRFNERV